MAIQNFYVPASKDDNKLLDKFEPAWDQTNCVMGGDEGKGGEKIKWGGLGGGWEERADGW